MRHVNDPVPDVRAVDPLIPETVALWVARATAKDPDERFADAASAWEAFEEAVLEHIGPLWRRDAGTRSRCASTRRTRPGASRPLPE